MVEIQDPRWMFNEVISSLHISFLKILDAWQSFPLSQGEKGATGFIENADLDVRLKALQVHFS